MLAIALVVVVAVGLAYVARRSHHPRGIGAFKSGPSGVVPVMFADAGSNSDDDESHDDGGDSGQGDADSTSGDGGGSGGDGGGGSGGSGGSGGDGGGGE